MEQEYRNKLFELGLVIILVAVGGGLYYASKHQKAVGVKSTDAEVVVDGGSVDAGTETSLPENMCYEPDQCNWSYGKDGLKVNPVCLNTFKKGFWTNHDRDGNTVVSCVCCGSQPVPRLAATVNDGGVDGGAVNGTFVTPK